MNVHSKQIAALSHSSHSQPGKIPIIVSWLGIAIEITGVFAQGKEDQVENQKIYELKDWLEQTVPFFFSEKK